MAIPVEQFTAPGKYEIDLAMEAIEAELRNNLIKYNKFEDHNYRVNKK